MRFEKTSIQGAYVIELDRLEDERGFYARAWCEKEFASHGMNLPFVQTNISYSNYKGTLRGMHYQDVPHHEAKLLRCIKGAIFEAIIDLRSDSPSYKKWFGVELSSENRKMLYVPGGIANGFETLQDDSEVLYSVTESYHPESERGIRFDDPAFRVQWPLKPVVISDKDRGWPDFES